MSELTKDQLKALGITNPQQASASAMEKMTDPESMYSLGKTSSSRERAQIVLAKSIGTNLKAFDFLLDYAQDRLMINLSDEKTTGRTGIIDMLKAPIISLGSDMKQGIKNFMDTK